MQHENQQQNASTRRQFLVGAAGATAVWAAPSVLGVANASAANGSCVPTTVNWSGGFYSGGSYTITGSQGNISIQAVMTPQFSAGGTRGAFLSGGNFGVAMSNHQIGDRYNCSVTVSVANGNICTADYRIIDVDQNGRGLGCSTNSRFRDEIHSIAGPGVSVSGQGGIIQSPPGVWASSLPCKTTNTEVVAISLMDNSPSISSTFSWIAGTPPGDDQSRLDRQIIMISPVTMCVHAPTASITSTDLRRSIAGADLHNDEDGLSGPSELD